MLTFLLLVFGKIDQFELGQNPQKPHIFTHTIKNIVASAKNKADAAEYMTILEDAGKNTPASQNSEISNLNNMLKIYQVHQVRQDSGKIVVTYKQKDSQTSSVVQAYLQDIKTLTGVTDKALGYFYDLVMSSFGQSNARVTGPSARSQSLFSGEPIIVDESHKLTDIDDGVLTADQFNDFLTTAVQNNQRLVDLNLSEMAINDAKADKLINQLPKMRSLTELNLTNNRLSHGKMKQLISSIGKHLKTLKHLSLRSVDRGACRDELSTVLSSILELTNEFSWQEKIKELTDQEVQLILAALKACKGDVKHIDLIITNAKLSDQNWIAFSQAFTDFSDTSEIRIDLRDNDISAELCNKIENNFSGTEERTILLPAHGRKKIDLIAKCFIYDENSDNLAFDSSPARLGDVLHFDDEAWEVMAKIIEESIKDGAKIKRFSVLSSNKLSAEQLNRLLDSLPKTLENLELADTGIDNYKAKIIKEKIKSKFVNFKELNLVANSLDKASVPEFMDELKIATKRDIKVYL